MGGERTDGESGWGVDTSKKISSRKLAIRIWSSEERAGPKIINLDHLFILAFKAVIMKEITYFKKKKSRGRREGSSASKPKEFHPAEMVNMTRFNKLGN